MIIKPRFRKSFCITSHPIGCEYNVYNQIYYVKKRNLFLKEGPKKVLIIGSSSGFGLASNIVTTFGFEAKTIGVFHGEKNYFQNYSNEGWYNIAALNKFSKILGLYSKNINCDAFSNECKNKVIKLIKKELGKIDLVIYSIYSKSCKSINNKTINAVIKPIDKKYKNKSINVNKNKIIKSTIKPASKKEIIDTLSVMGGLDWELWMTALKESNVLENGVLTIAYSYISSDIISPIYRDGTIGLAKYDFDRSAKNIHKNLRKLNGNVNVVILKPTITKSTYLNPYMNLYISILYKIMKKKNLHEDCISQIFRLMSTCLYNKYYETDKYNRIRMDTWEKRTDIQKECKKIWRNVNTYNLKQKTDYFNCKRDFLRLFGFYFSEVNYKININTDIDIDII
ncbi:enoyl-[acyl-carrier-protein] reductase FabV [Enterobacteriaceae bacterium ET-AT1-13]|nr:enoyl-[acyl-carrier-protein] reductase FabV [Enterobacteriaceae bacterium ET-AT1-13]WGS66446.1 enoyl-[acyl-carrier-protein] reductase FabV [Enterobacteriaceae bacterium Cmel17]WMC17471.1 MAG: enoyl-[acyl-carrier-protein] reductase FabV [Enterobacteriaceae bacterium Cmel21]WMC17678.1 MAG: enoyl-[acyl-carrier-protein] reductase FabV [Enterobacteriaceae bacterium PSmelAO3-2]WMC17882.1 MAG: enoyl-[acyl-carrier-protein] reductase FabV [Enterobacteriaceae bacterium PSmelAO3-1]WMC18085.1 MAG: enoy